MEKLINLVFSILLTATSFAIPSSAAPERINVKSYGAAGNGTTDDQVAITRAIAALKGKGGTLYFPAGVYLHSDILVIEASVVVEGAGGEASTLKSGNPVREALEIINTENCGITNMKFQGAPSQRLRNALSADIFLKNDQHCTIQGVSIDGGGSAGILVNASQDIQVINNDVRNTMADGIHVVGGSRNVTVADNKAYNTGDDSFAVVAYAPASQTSDIVVRGNTSVNSVTRGVTCIGAANCVLENNTIVSPKDHGIVVGHDTFYKTHYPSGARVVGNKVQHVKTAGMEPILINDAKNVEVGRNVVEDSRPVYVIRSQDVSVTGLEIHDSVSFAILVRESQNVHIRDTQIFGAGGPGIAFDRVTGGEIVNNTLNDVKTSDKSAAGDIDIVRSTRISGDGNRSIHHSALSTQMIRVLESDAAVKVNSQ